MTLEPGSPEWLRVVTASKVAAILGLSPWQSPYSLWQQMKGNLPTTAETDTTRRGHYLEPAILAWWRDQHRVTLDNFTEQPAYQLGTWAAATPDAAACVEVWNDRGDDTVLVEAKSTAQEWDGELPVYYLTQVIWQMHVSGVHRCHVPVIGPRLTFIEYVIDYADYAADAALIEARAREFYDSLAADTPPPLDDTVATFDAVKRIHPDIDKGEAVELTAHEAVDLTAAAADLKTAEAADRLARSTVIERMGRANYATYDGVKVARRQNSKYGVSFVVTAKPEDLTLSQEPA